MKLDLFTRAYLECLLWSETDEDGDPLDSLYDIDAIHDDSIARAVEDCSAFQLHNAADLSDLDPEQSGHDFCLTRNRHGAGFWDRGLGSKGERLTEACRPYGTCNAYVGDDNLVHLT